MDRSGHSYGPRWRRVFRPFSALVCVITLSGCWAPLVSHGVPASKLGEEFRAPIRTGGTPLNYANLTLRPPQDYILGSGDILEVTIPELTRDAQLIRPMRAMVMSSGEIYLPLVGAVRVGGMNLLQAQQTVMQAYVRGKQLLTPSVNLVLAEKAMVDVVVLGAVNAPGVYPLPKYQNDVGHALAAAGGLTIDAGDQLQVHRRLPRPEVFARLLPPVRPASATLPSGPPTFDGPPMPWAPAEVAVQPGELMELPPAPGMSSPHGPDPHAMAGAEDPKTVFTIRLRGVQMHLAAEQVALQSGDVLVVPNRRNEVFFVVGKLAPSNLVRFTLGERERELGGGFILPKDREVDVVTAVAMAGYIDPIDSPTTVTVQRVMPDGQPLLIHVDLIKARYDRNETVLVQPGDILYLNPDWHWWFRRTFDRMAAEVFLAPYRAAMFNKWIPTPPGR